MGYPHKPHGRESTVLSKHFGNRDAISLEGWKKLGGYKALESALGMQPADIVHLKSQQVPEPVRQEDAGKAGLHGLIGVAGDDVRVVQQLGDQPMGGEVHISPIHARSRIAKCSTRPGATFFSRTSTHGMPTRAFASHSVNSLAARAH